MPTLMPEAFKNVNSNPGLQIWSIEKMEPVPLATKAYGTFFEGDCYIILFVKKTSTGRSQALHFWLGKESSQDEQGSAAIFVTQLDEYLGGSPIQYREVQAHESSAFKSYFKNGIVYKKGGVASSFNHVETNMYNIKRLLHLKGRKSIMATEVDLSWRCFNNGDIFLLDLGKVIVQWNSPGSSKMKRLKALRMAQSIRDNERGGRTQVGIVDGDQEEASPELMRVMTSVLGERTEALRDAPPDEEPNQQQKCNVRLYHVSDETGSLVVQEIATRPLTQDLLKHEDCYFLDQGGTKLFVWKGKESRKEEKDAAFRRAMGFIHAKGYPDSTNVEVLNDGAESAIFTQLFKQWKVKGMSQGFGKTYRVGQIAKVEKKKFDVTLLYAEPELAAHQRMVDDGSGKLEIWRIEELEMEPVDPRTYGHFYGGDCYLILYTYLKRNKPAYLIYFWQGLHATKDEITASAFQAVNLDNKYNDEAVQVRVVMGKEPRHFLAIFKGNLIVYQGGTGRKGGQAEEPPVRLFQVRGTDEMNTKATEVPARASSLNSNDVFVLNTEQTTYLWCGKGCSGDEREMAKSVSNHLSKREKQTVLEQQEPAEFWVALGGKAPYASNKRFQEEECLVEPRLFECSNQTGCFIMTEIYDFTQEDLDEEDVMLLDTWTEIFLWMGKSANTYEKKESYASTDEYLQYHPAGRDLDTPVITVKQGFEPPTFTGWFNAWDPHKWNTASDRSYDELRNNLKDVSSISQISVEFDDKEQRLKRSPAPSSPTYVGHSIRFPENNSPPSRSPEPDLPPPIGSITNNSKGCYPRDMLINKTVDELPGNVDPTRKEEFLLENDFLELFGMTLDEFSTKPGWQQKAMKKQAGLF